MLPCPEPAYESTVKNSEESNGGQPQERYYQKGGPTSIVLLPWAVEYLSRYHPI